MPEAALTGRGLIIMVFLIKTAQLLLCFCILILLHEGGHFFFAKLFGIRVSKFCLFFDPWIKPLKLFTYKGTDYCIGWLPLGGYVSIEGMVDESTSADKLGKEVQPWEFRAKPAWQRLLVMVGGVLVNFLLALFIYAMVFFAWGETYVPQRNMTEGYVFNEEAQALGFRDGDIILAADGVAFKSHSGDIYRAISTAHECTVLREGREVGIALPGNLNMLDMIQSSPRFMDLRQGNVVDSVIAGGPAAKAGMMKGDRIVSVNGKETASGNAVMYELSVVGDVVKSENLKKARKTTLVVARGEAFDTLTAEVGEDAKLNILFHSTLADYKTVTEHYGFFESFPAGISYGWNVLCGYVSDLKYLFTKDGAKSVGSFGTIGSLFPATWDWGRFWELTAFISLMLAFMNFLPIPALDGGYIFLTLLEVITRRRFPDKVVEVLNTIGMWLLIALMAYAIFNDIDRFLL